MDKPMEVIILGYWEAGNLEALSALVPWPDEPKEYIENKYKKDTAPVRKKVDICMPRSYNII